MVLRRWWRSNGGIDGLLRRGGGRGVGGKGGTF